MTADHRSSNQALVRHLLLPTIFLTVALLGGLRVSADTGAFLFIAPPLITLVLAVLLMALVVRGRIVNLRRWLNGENHPLTNISHALTLAALFFASAQSFNSVLPEAGLLRWLFSFFFLWTLWNNQFSSFDARRLVRSLAVLFGTAFLLKHMLFASLYDSEGGWLKRLAGALLEGATLGTFDAPVFAPATGYISFFTLLLYVAGLALLPSAPDATDDERDAKLMPDLLYAFRQLSPAAQVSMREEILRSEQKQLEADSQIASDVRAEAIRGSIVYENDER